MGVAVVSVPVDLSAHLGLAEGLYLLVDTVQAGSPADQAGLRAHDLLTHLDDQVLVNPPHEAFVRLKKAGDEVTLRYLRAGKEQLVKLKLTEQEIPDEESAAPTGPAWGPPGFAPGAPDVRDAFRRMQEQMQRMHGRAGFPPVPDPFADEDDALPGSSGSVHSSASSSCSASMVNDQGRFTFTEQNGNKTFRAESPDGKVKFDGPANTEEERGKVPGEFRDVLRDLDWAGARRPGARYQGPPRAEGAGTQPRPVMLRARRSRFPAAFFAHADQGWSRLSRIRTASRWRV